MPNSTQSLNLKVSVIINFSSTSSFRVLRIDVVHAFSPFSIVRGRELEMAQRPESRTVQSDRMKDIAVAVVGAVVGPLIYNLLRFIFVEIYCRICSFCSFHFPDDALILAIRLQSLSSYDEKRGNQQVPYK
jgi:hypothetical protein